MKIFSAASSCHFRGITIHSSNGRSSLRFNSIFIISSTTGRCTYSTKSSVPYLHSPTMSHGKHLSAGSSVPTLPDDGKIRLFSMRFCPFAQRVHLVLDAKDIPHHTIFVNLTTKPEFLFQHSPAGTVPAVQLPAEKNQSLYESLVIADYLDAKFPQRPLYPKCPFAKARDQLVIKKFESVISAMYKVFVNPTPEPGAIIDIAVKLDEFEAELKRRGTQYFHGDIPGMVDYMIWPWCERADMLGFLIGDRYELDNERFPNLVKWRVLMKNDKAVKQSFLSGEHHAKYMVSRRQGVPDYDMLVNSTKKLRTE